MAKTKLRKSGGQEEVDSGEGSIPVVVGDVVASSGALLAGGVKRVPKGDSKLDDFSCFKEVRVEYPIHLPPSYIGGPLPGVIRILGEHLLKLVPSPCLLPSFLPLPQDSRYSKELGGVPLSMGSPGLLQTSAAIISDLPEIHFAVTTKFLVFSPSVGKKMGSLRLPLHTYGTHTLASGCGSSDRV